MATGHLVKMLALILSSSALDAVSMILRENMLEVCCSSPDLDQNRMAATWAVGKERVRVGGGKGAVSQAQRPLCCAASVGKNGGNLL